VINEESIKINLADAAKNHPCGFRVFRILPPAGSSFQAHGRAGPSLRKPIASPKSP